MAEQLYHRHGEEWQERDIQPYQCAAGQQAATETGLYAEDQGPMIDHTKPHTFQFSYSPHHGTDVHIPPFCSVLYNLRQSVWRGCDKVQAMCYPIPLAWVGVGWGLALAYATWRGKELHDLLFVADDVTLRGGTSRGRGAGSWGAGRGGGSRGGGRGGGRGRTGTGVITAFLHDVADCLCVLTSFVGSFLLYFWYRRVLTVLRALPFYKFVQHRVPSRFQPVVLLSTFGASAVVTSTILHRFALRQLLRYWRWQQEKSSFTGTQWNDPNDMRRSVQEFPASQLYPPYFYWAPVCDAARETSAALAYVEHLKHAADSHPSHPSTPSFTGFSSRTRLWAHILRRFIHPQIPRTRVYERCLPQQPLPCLESTVQAYLEASQPLYFPASSPTDIGRSPVPKLTVAGAAKWLREDAERGEPDGLETPTRGQSDRERQLQMVAATPFASSPASGNPPNYLLMESDQNQQQQQRVLHFPSLSLPPEVVGSEWRQLCRLAARFLSEEGPKLQEQLRGLNRSWRNLFFPSSTAVTSASSIGVTYTDHNYMMEWWKKSVYLSTRHSLLYDSNYMVTPYRNYTPSKYPTARAAVLIHLLGELCENLSKGCLPPVFAGLPNARVPVSMEQLFAAFRTTRVPGRETDRLEHTERGWVDDKNSPYYTGLRYVIVIHLGKMYQLFLDRPSQSHAKSDTEANHADRGREPHEPEYISTVNRKLTGSGRVVPCTPYMLEQCLKWIVNDVQLRDSPTAPATNNAEPSLLCGGHDTHSINNSLSPLTPRRSRSRRSRSSRRGGAGQTSFTQDDAEAEMCDPPVTEDTMRCDSDMLLACNASEAQPQADGDDPSATPNPAHPDSPFASFILSSNDPLARAKEAEYERVVRLLPSLTSLPRAEWSDIRQRYFLQDPTNCLPLRVVERALFVVSLDDCVGENGERARPGSNRGGKADTKVFRQPIFQESRDGDACRAGSTAVDVSVSSILSSTVCEDLCCSSSSSHISSSSIVVGDYREEAEAEAERAESHEKSKNRDSAPENFTLLTNAQLAERSVCEPETFSGTPPEPSSLSPSPSAVEKNAEGEGVVTVDAPLGSDTRRRAVEEPVKEVSPLPTQSEMPSDESRASHQSAFFTSLGRPNGKRRSALFPHLWADKSFNLVVDRCGYAGFHVEASWGDPAVFQWIVDYLSLRELKAGETPEDDAPIAAGTPLYYYDSHGKPALLSEEDRLIEQHRRNTLLSRSTDGGSLPLELGNRPHHKGRRSNRVVVAAPPCASRSPVLLLTPCHLHFQLHQPLASAIQKAFSVHCETMYADGAGGGGSAPIDSHLEGGDDASHANANSRPRATSFPSLDAFTIRVKEGGQQFIASALAASGRGRSSACSIAPEPGTWVILAVQLAHLQTQGYLSQIYETIPLLCFQHSRSESIRCLSPETAWAMEKLMGDGNTEKPPELMHWIREACGAQSRKRRLARVGGGSERHLLSLFLMSSRSHTPSEFLSRVLRHLQWKVHIREHTPALCGTAPPSVGLTFPPPDSRHDSGPNSLCGSSRRRVTTAGGLTVGPLSHEGYGVSFCFQPGVERRCQSPAADFEDPFSIPHDEEESVDITVTCHRDGAPVSASVFAHRVSQWLHRLAVVAKEAADYY